MKLDLPIDSINTIISALRLAQALVNNALNTIELQAHEPPDPPPEAATVPAELSSAE